MVNTMTFGEKLKDARKKSGLSQEELAERIGVSRAAIAKWETDKGLPDIENLKAIAGLLDVSIDYLLDDENKLDLSVIKEPIDLSMCKGFIEKANAKDRLVKERFADCDVYSLLTTKKLTTAQIVRDEVLTLFTAFLPEIGSFDSGTDILNAFENRNNAFYLAEDDSRQYFVIASDEFLEIHQLARRITEKKFEIGNWKLKKAKKL